VVPSVTGCRTLPSTTPCATAQIVAGPPERSPKTYASSEHGRRLFCGDCGTSLFYTNDVVFPGQIDVQTATLDDPSAIPLQGQIQMAESIAWMRDLSVLPAFERYPGEEPEAP